MEKDLLGLVKSAGRIRGDPFVEDEFIIQAHKMIERGEVVASEYPNGVASLRGIYRLALMLQTDGIFKNAPAYVQ